MTYSTKFSDHPSGVRAEDNQQSYCMWNAAPEPSPELLLYLRPGETLTESRVRELSEGIARHGDARYEEGKREAWKKAHIAATRRFPTVAFDTLSQKVLYGRETLSGEQQLKPGQQTVLEILLRELRAAAKEDGIALD